MKLNVVVAGIKFRNQILAASGTFGYGGEYEELIDLSQIGGFVTKSITLNPTQGNPPPRVCEVDCGMINSIGLQNEGLDCFIKEKLPLLKKINTNIIVSIAGFSAEEYVEITRVLSREKGICAIELNLSCPNINPVRNNGSELKGISNRVKDKKGDMRGVLHFAQDEKILYSVVSKVKKKSKLPVFVKLTPNIADITVLAKSAEKAGADAVTLINTPLAMAVDIEARRPKIKSVMGGLSGPAIKPIALRMVWQAARVLKIPVIGVGGISSWQDAVEFILCGAALLQIGTASFIDPETLINVVKGIEEYLKRKKLASPYPLIGGLLLK